MDQAEIPCRLFLGFSQFDSTSPARCRREFEKVIGFVGWRHLLVSASAECLPLGDRSICTVSSVPGSLSANRSALTS